MKTYELEYKMKKQYRRKDGLQELRNRVLKKKAFTEQDQYLESAQDYLNKLKMAKEKQTPVLRNYQMDIKNFKRDQNVPSSPNLNSNKNHSSSITPHNLKKSLQTDRSQNLDYWRKEAFKYQQQVFALERKNSQLSVENSNLKFELQIKRNTKLDQSSKGDAIKTDIFMTDVIKKNYEKRIEQLSLQLALKMELIQKLQTKIVMMSHQVQEGLGEEEKKNLIQSCSLLIQDSKKQNSFSQQQQMYELSSSHIEPGNYHSNNYRNSESFKAKLSKVSFDLQQGRIAHHLIGKNKEIQFHKFAHQRK